MSRRGILAMLFLGRAERICVRAQSRSAKPVTAEGKPVTVRRDGSREEAHCKLKQPSDIRARSSNG